MMNKAKTTAHILLSAKNKTSNRPSEKNPLVVVFTSTDITQRNKDELSKEKVKKLLDYVLENHDMFETPIVTLPPRDNPTPNFAEQPTSLSFQLIERTKRIAFDRLCPANKST